MDYFARLSKKGMQVRSVWCVQNLTWDTTEFFCRVSCRVGVDRETLFLGSANWRLAENVQTFVGCKVSELHLADKVATTTTDKFHFANLVIATGSTVNFPALPGMDLRGVAALRSLRDAQDLVALKASRIVVLGGGLLGLEAADALVQLGHDVHVVHRGKYLMNRQLNKKSAELLCSALELKGIRVSCGVEITALEGDAGAVRRARLSDSRSETVDLVLVATGVCPNVVLAQSAGLNCNDGVLVDKTMQTSDKCVFALGECAEFAEGSQNLVEAVNTQALALAQTLCGEEREFEGRSFGTHLKVRGQELYAVGRTSQSFVNDVVIEDLKQGIYRHFFVDDRRLVGAILLGATQGARSIAARIGQSTEDFALEPLVFGFDGIGEAA